MKRKLNRGFKLPVSSLLGSRVGNYIRTTIIYRYYFPLSLRYYLSFIICLIFELFRYIEYIRNLRRIKRSDPSEPPIFIIGFWRSGTTLMHQMLSKDPQFAYVTTYQTIFPDLMVYQHQLKWLASFLMPEKRPVDNLKLAMDDPQEEEIGLANLTHRSFYHFIYFPKAYRKIKELSLDINDLDGKELKKWERSYRYLIRQAVLNTSGKRFLSKNPPNTFRIKLLLKLFPGAKFIYLYRNPYKALSSFSLFFDELIDGVGFQKVSKEKYLADIQDLYSESLSTYIDNKGLIPPENLIEVKFEDFIKTPLEYAEMVYKQFGLELSRESLERMKEYLKSYRDYKSASYTVPDPIIRMINSNFTQYLIENGYEKINPVDEKSDGT